MISPDQQISHYYPADFQFVDQKLNEVPFYCRPALSKIYSSLYESLSRRDANLHLLGASGEFEGIQFNQSPEALKFKSKHLAMECQRLLKTQGFTEAYEHVQKTLVLLASLPEPGTKKAAKFERYYAPRISDAVWVFRQVTKTLDRQTESASIAAGIVCKAGDVYCSQHLLNLVIERQNRSARIMAELFATSSEGEEINMLDILNGSISNPAVRRAELMVRMRGFEEHARKAGDVGIFYTITAPSKYHANHANGTPNKKFCGATPRDTQGYLCQIWSQIRSSLDRQAIHPYGFRVVEPHHDGTPHWHILLFVDRNHRHALTETLRTYAFKEDGKERGAFKNRFTAVDINTEFGSATGYIAKYISKNIDGFGVGSDLETENLDTEQSSIRVRGWSSIWGIRQFQQIGGAPVGVWRELRRCSEEILGDARLELARLAADTADWLAYLEIQGGAACSRKAQPIRTLSENFSRLSGEVYENCYGESVKKVSGVLSLAFEYITRTKEWVIERKSNGTERVAPWSSVNNCTAPGGA